MCLKSVWQFLVFFHKGGSCFDFMLHLDPKFTHWTSPKIFTFSWTTVPCFSNRKGFLYGNIISFCTYRLCCLCLVLSHFSLFFIDFYLMNISSIHISTDENILRKSWNCMAWPLYLLHVEGLYLVPPTQQNKHLLMSLESGLSPVIVSTSNSKLWITFVLAVTMYCPKHWAFIAHQWGNKILSDHTNHPNTEVNNCVFLLWRDSQCHSKFTAKSSVQSLPDSFDIWCLL